MKTMRSRNLNRRAAGCAVAASSVIMSGSALASGEKIKMVDASAWGGFFSGGPYEIEPVSFSFTPGGAGQFGATGGNFLTFAVEYNDAPWEGPYKYDVAFNTEALDNGAGGGNNVIGTGSIDSLNDRTAFLYTIFARGQIDAKVNAFDGSTFTYGDKDSGKALQQAIWSIEVEIGGVTGLAASLVDMANAAIQSSGEWFNKGIGSVRVLNVTDSTGYGYQDMLVMIPLPIPAALGLVGLLGVGLIVRRERG